MTQAEIIAQRKAITRRLNKHGYFARKFTDSDTALLCYERGDRNGPYARIIYEDVWGFRCYGTSEMINPMTICGHIEKAIGLVEG